MKMQVKNRPDKKKIIVALKKDFRKLYVPQYTSTWGAERTIREIELDLMGLDNILALFPDEEEIRKQEAIEHTKDLIKRARKDYLGLSDGEQEFLSALSQIVWDMDGVRKQEMDRILNYLKSLAKSNPKASLLATIDLIETTNPENYSK